MNHSFSYCSYAPSSVFFVSFTFKLYCLCVSAKVVRKTEARYTGRHHYGINLYNCTSTCYQVNIASQLVVTNYAYLSKDKLKVGRSLAVYSLG